MFRQALIAVDGTDRDTELVRYAQVLLRLSPDVRCEFIHVLGWAGRLPPGTPPVTHQQALRQLEEKVSKHFGDRLNRVDDVGALLDERLYLNSVRVQGGEETVEIRADGSFFDPAVFFTAGDASAEIRMQRQALLGAAVRLRGDPRRNAKGLR